MAHFSSAPETGSAELAVSSSGNADDTLETRPQRKRKAPEMFNPSRRIVEFFEERHFLNSQQPSTTRPTVDFIFPSASDYVTKGSRHKLQWTLSVPNFAQIINDCGGFYILLLRKESSVQSVYVLGRNVVCETQGCICFAEIEFPEEVKS